MNTTEEVLKLVVDATGDGFGIVVGRRSPSEAPALALPAAKVGLPRSEVLL